MLNIYNNDDDSDVIAEAEIAPDDIELDTEESEFKDKLKTLREKLKTCESEKMSHLEELQRVKADFLNSKRRLEEQLQKDKERATDKILFDLLTLVDSFDTAMLDKEAWESTDAKWRTGVEAIYSKLLSMLTSYNISPFDPVGLPFNPEEHDAVANTKVENKKQVDVVQSVLQKGYKRNNDIMRPARVSVGTK